MLQHHDTAQQQRRRVRQPFPRYIGSGPMHCLENTAFVANIPRWSKSQPADQTRTHVGEDIAVEVRHHEDFIVVRGRVRDDFEACVVEEFGIEVYGWKILRYSAGGVEEEPVGHFHDGRFVDGADFAFADVFGVLEGEP